MDGVFNLILQMDLKCLWLPFLAWDPGEEFPSIEGTLFSSQSRLKAIASSSLLCLSLCKAQQNQVWLNIKLGPGCFGLVSMLLDLVLGAFLAGNFGVVQLRKRVLP